MPPVFNEKCNMCGNCIEDCPGNILIMGDNRPEVAYPEECWHCGTCRTGCLAEAITINFPVYMLI